MIRAARHENSINNGTCVGPETSRGNHFLRLSVGSPDQGRGKTIMSENQARLFPVERIQSNAGNCWFAPLPPEAGFGDQVDNSTISKLELFEDSVRIGPAHSLHDKICGDGGGRYSHWGNSLFFSASDNTNPLENGRSYQMLIPASDSVSHLKGQLIDAIHSAEGMDEEETRYLLGERLLSFLCPKYKVSEYGRVFFDDRDFLADYEQFDSENFRSFDRKFTVYQMAKLIGGLEGDTAECGVWRGASSYLIAKAIASMGLKKTHHMFDSFEGLSAPGEIDGDFWSEGAMSFAEDDVRESFSKFPNVKFHRGWIPERFSEVADRYFCFLHIDVDLYEPTRQTLEFFYPRMSSGGVILCDDYGFAICPGARKAIDDFFADKPECVIELPTGQGFILRQGC
jgi:hypothetical protein